MSRPRCGVQPEVGSCSAQHRGRRRQGRYKYDCAYVLGVALNQIFQHIFRCQFTFIDKVLQIGTVVCYCLRDMLVSTTRGGRLPSVSFRFVYLHNNKYTTNEYPNVKLLSLTIKYTRGHFKIVNFSGSTTLAQEIIVKMAGQSIISHTGFKTTLQTPTYRANMCEIYTRHKSDYCLPLSVKN